MSDNTAPNDAPARATQGRLRRVFEVAWISAAALGFVAVGLTIADVPTTVRDFFIPGTQPLAIDDPMSSATNCSNCHAFYDEEREPYTPWAASMMGQATRDPIFHACLAIANQDAAFAGDLCLAFGANGGVWLTGGVLDGLGDAFDTDASLQAFDDKGRYAASQREVPVRRVLAGDLAFRGLARIVEGACRAPGVALGEAGPD